MKWLTAVFLCIAAVLAGLLVYRQVAPPAIAGGTAIDNPVKLPALPLISDQGQNTTLAASDGRMRLMFFGYVHCPDVCPATLASLKNTYAGLTSDQRQRLQVQLVSVDPLTDTPNLLRDYLGRFDPAFTGLTGKVDTIDAAAKALFVSNIAPMPADMPGMNHGTHSHANDPVSAPAAARIHGDQVSVITPGGEFVRVYTNQEAIDGTLQKDLPGLIKKYGG